MSAQALLTGAALLVDQGWSQHADARDANGSPIEPWNADARSWSLLGALVTGLEQVAASEGEPVAVQQLAQACMLLASTLDVDSLERWNDDAARTKADVSAALAHAVHSAETNGP
jgi:hypothetical protein